MNKIDRLYQYLPKDDIDWELLKKTLLKPFFLELENTHQEPKWHQEGNVFIHTKMVCETLIKDTEYQLLDKENQLVVFLAALFHDIGKIYCTKVIGDEITSYHHGPKGAVVLREYLWKDLGLSGSEKYQAFREGICLLVKYHSVPIHQDLNLTKTVIRLSLNWKLTPYFTLKNLSILAKADCLGRIGNEYEMHLENITLFKEQALELNCFTQSFQFSDSYTKYQYLIGENIWHYQSLFNNHWGEVILVCGLPGTGKDTFIQKEFPDYPVISLDNIRTELKIGPNDDQAAVYTLAKEKAKAYLRNHQVFVWNATNLTNMIRNKQLNLFHDYNASVKIIFLETELQTNLLRNRNRKKAVSEKVIYKMLGDINIPEAFEAEEVSWIIL